MQFHVNYESALSAEAAVDLFLLCRAGRCTAHTRWTKQVRERGVSETHAAAGLIDITLHLSP
jgi:hypothetical protein